MWHKSIFTLILLVGAISSETPTKNVFTAVSPKIIKENSKYVVNIAVDQKSPSAIQFTVSVNASKTENSDDILYSSAPVDIQPGNSVDIEVDVKALPVSAYNLTIIGKYSDGSGEFHDFANIYRNSKTASLLIQTDKVIYKPGETVKFRVVLLDNLLRPLDNQLVNVTISDPQRNVIKVFTNETVSKGIFSSSIPISSEPNLGDWKIYARSSNGQFDHYLFTVDQYVLPKFKVEVKIPTFVTYNSSKFTAEIKTAYTYGKPLKGDVEVRLQEYYRYSWGAQPQKIVSKKSPIDGSVFFEFDIGQELGQGPLTYDKQFQVLATVTDALTGRQQNGTSIIRVTPYPYKIDMIETPRNYKPGFPLTLKFKVSTQDDIPIADTNPEALKIEHGFACNAEEGILFKSVPANGIVNVTFQTPTNEFVSANSLKVTYKDLVYNGYPPQKSTTPSKAYMQIEIQNATRTPEVGSTVDVQAIFNKEIDSISYLLFARGKILRAEHITNFPAPAYKEINLSIKDIPAEAAPEATIVVYTVLPSNEIIAESIKVNLPSVFENQLQISVSKKSGQPGDKVQISLDTAGDSLIALRGVDQSVLLLKEDKDITTKTIEGEVKSFQNQVNNHRSWGGSNSFQVFEESGVIIITNGALEKPYRYHGPVNVALSYESQAYYDSPPPRLPGTPAAAFATTPIAGGAPVRKKVGNTAGPEIRIRKDFPETWLWEEIQANVSSTHIDKIIPDTLTSWYISGYALSPSKGIGVVPKPVVLETFRPFFISLNLPYSVVKGEIFGLQVLAHNYMNNEVTADVTLKNTGEAMEFQEEENKNQAESTKSITIGPNEVKSLIFVVKPVKFGTTSLDVKAVTTSSGVEQAGDAISRPLIVRPPGQKQTMNKAILVDLRNTSTSQDTIDISYPPTRVEGADSLKVTVISDLLGSTVSNLDKLLKMPCGCGEQNMVYFVPDVVILQYLESSGTLTPAIKNKAVRFLESGYQRQLTYRHDDGSFSAFGKHDTYGSTWLTAFVVRSFVAANPYITIDDSVIIQALKFLQSKQQSDGSFVEHGTVLQNELKGGAVESLSLSSYVLLAFLESSKLFNDTVANITETTNKGLGFITQAPTGLDNPYTASLITYTLKVAGNEKAAVFKQILESLAKRDGDLKYWEPKPVEKPANASEALNRPWVPRIKPISVEMTSYALLTYLLEGNLEEALPVARWLLQQRNEQGGFISTQDTVVGLTALAKFAMTTKSGSTDLVIRVAQELGVVTFEVNKQNEIVLQERSLPPFVKSVNINGEGTGTALAQVTWSYYVEDKSEEPAFGLDIKTVSKASKLQIDICSWYTHVKDKASNMAVMEVNLPSGFTFDSDGLTEITSVEGVKRYELEEGDSQLNIYFDSLSAKKTCLTLPANRVFKVANPAKPYVQVFDYYDTTLRARQFYESPEFSACEICKDEDSCAIKNCV